MSLFENQSVEPDMEPGDVILRQLKAKFPPKKSHKGKDGSSEKVKKMKKKVKKVKKVKVIEPEEDLGTLSITHTFQYETEITKHFCHIFI